VEATVNYSSQQQNLTKFHADLQNFSTEDCAPWLHTSSLCTIRHNHKVIEVILALHDSKCFFQPTLFGVFFVDFSVIVSVMGWLLFSQLGIYIVHLKLWCLY